MFKLWRIIGNIVIWIGILIGLIPAGRLLGHFEWLINSDEKLVAMILLMIAVFFMGALINNAGQLPKNKYDRYRLASARKSAAIGLLLTVILLTILLWNILG